MTENREELFIVIDENGRYVGVPCLSFEEAYELAANHENASIYFGLKLKSRKASTQKD